MTLTTKGLTDLLRAALATKDRELTCDELLEVMAQVAEARRNSTLLPDELRPLVEDHLEKCAACHEELSALLAALE